MENIFVAFSGGADSVCLLYILNKLIKENPEYSEYSLNAIHINHNIRKKESIRDENFCKNFCMEYGINLISIKVDVPDFAKKYSLGIEEAARICRYNIFKKVCGNNKIFLAHHLNDQAETIVLNIIRGSGIAGLSGMQDITYLNFSNNLYDDYFKKFDKKGNINDNTSLTICRPLLKISKEQILKYIKNEGLNFVNDTTNFDDNYTRNFVRLKVMPLFEKVNKKSLNHIYDLAKLANDADRDYKKWASDELTKIASSNNNIISMEINDVKLYSDLKIYYLISSILFDGLHINKKDWTKKHFFDILNMLKKESGGHIDLPCNITVDKKSKILTFIKNDYNISMDKRKNK